MAALPGNDRQLYFVERTGDLDAISSDLLHAPRVSVDLETDGLNISTHETAGFCIVSDKIRAYFPVRHRGSVCLPSSQAFDFLRRTCKCVPDLWFHNAAFDVAMMMRDGVDVPDTSIRDTMLAAYAVGEPRVGLKYLAREKLGIRAPDFQDVIGARPATTLLSDNVGPYCISDGFLTLKLADYLIPKMQQHGVFKPWMDVENPFTKVIAYMKMYGMKVDQEYLIQYDDELRVKAMEVEPFLYSYGGGPFNVGSSQQLADVLYNRLGYRINGKIPMTKKNGEDTKNPSTGKEVLQNLAWRASGDDKKFLETLIYYRGIETLLSRYTTTLVDYANMHPDGRIRGNINQTVARTGRLSSSDPNLQNLPSRSDEGILIRKAFVPEDGFVILGTDYSQIELRIIAHLSQDPNMLSIYRTGYDINGNHVGDIHQATKNEIERMLGREIDRTHAKGTNFGFGYGMGHEKFAWKNGVPVDTALAFKNAYFSAYSRIAVLNKSIVEFCKKHGYVESITGRKRWFSNPEKAYSDAINNRTQASAADMMKLGMIYAMRLLEQRDYMGKEAKIIMTVHDEMLTEVKQDYVETITPLVKAAMEEVGKTLNISVPVLAAPVVGMNWMEAH